VSAPKQRNTKEEKQAIKAGETPKEWEKQPGNLAENDVDAPWSKHRASSQTISFPMVPSFGACC
jgi:transposase, IS5 family